MGKSQMNLTLFIGDVLVGIVVLVIGLIIAWSTLSSTTDACKIAAGINSDILSIVRSLYATPGDITVNYQGPKMCRVTDNKLLICRPTSKGWNPNITSIKLFPLRLHGGFGYDKEAPVALVSRAHVEWESSGMYHGMDLDIYDLYVYSFAYPETIELHGHNNVIQISKEFSVFGDSFSKGALFDPLAGDSRSIANTIVELKNSCGDEGGTLSRELNILLPAAYQLSWSKDKKLICIDQLVLNSKYRSFDDVRAIVYQTNLYASYQGCGTNPTCWEKAKLGPVDFVVNDSNYDDLSNAFFVRSFDGEAKKVYMTWGLCSDTLRGLVCNATDECAVCKIGYTLSIDDTSQPVSCRNNQQDTKSCKETIYDPYEQSLVSKYHVGWKQLRCFNYSKIGEDLGVNVNDFAEIESQLQPNFVASDGMNHTLVMFDHYNDVKRWVINVSYDCDTNHTTITFLEVK